MTITVQAAPMTVSVGGDAPTFTATKGAVVNPQLFHSSSNLSFANPSSQPGQAKITVSRDATDLQGLRLGVSLDSASSDEYTISGSDFFDSDPEWENTETQAADIARAVQVGADLSNRVLVWALAGTAPSTDVVIATTFTFTIAQS